MGVISEEKRVRDAQIKVSVHSRQGREEMRGKYPGGGGGSFSVFGGGGGGGGGGGDGNCIGGKGKVTVGL